MTDDLIFEEPPQRNNHGGKAGQSPLGRWLSALRDHPGAWAKYPEPIAPTNGTLIRKGRGYGVEAGEFEVRTVNIPNVYPPRVHLYARYTPKD